MIKSKEDLLRRERAIVHNKKLSDLKKLHLRWKLMKSETIAQIQAKNSVCKRMDKMYLELKNEKI